MRKMRVAVTGLLCVVAQGAQAQSFEQQIRRKLPGAALLLVLFACVATASAQMKAVFSRPMPTSAAVGLQQFLGSSAGAPLLAANPALLTVLGLNVSNPAHLQALGPLSARLPVDFVARAAADAVTARAVFSSAYSMSSNDAVGEIDAYARAAVLSAASDANAWRGLGSAASDLKSYSLYGEAARERVTLFAQKAATVRSQELAKGLSLSLLAGLRGPESFTGAIPAGLVDKNSFARRNARLSPAPRSASAREFVMTPAWGNLIGSMLLSPVPNSISQDPRLDNIRDILIPKRGERVTVHTESPVFVIAAAPLAAKLSAAGISSEIFLRLSYSERYEALRSAVDAVEKGAPLRNNPTVGFAPGIGPSAEVQRHRAKAILESIKNADKPLPPGAIRIGVFVDGGGIGTFTGEIVEQVAREGDRLVKIRVIREARLETMDDTSRLLTRRAAESLARRLGYQDVSSVPLRKVPVWNPFPTAIKIFRQRTAEYGGAIGTLVEKVFGSVRPMPTIYPSPHSLSSFASIVDAQPDGRLVLVPRGQVDNVVVMGADIGLYHPDVSNGK